MLDTFIVTSKDIARNDLKRLRAFKLMQIHCQESGRVNMATETEIIIINGNEVLDAS